MYQQEEFPTAASRAVKHRWVRRTSSFRQFLTCWALSNSLSFSGISPSSIATLDPWTWKRGEWVKLLDVSVFGLGGAAGLLHLEGFAHSNDAVQMAAEVAQHTLSSSHWDFLFADIYLFSQGMSCLFTSFQRLKSLILFWHGHFLPERVLH